MITCNMRCISGKDPNNRRKMKFDLSIENRDKKKGEEYNMKEAQALDVCVRNGKEKERERERNEFKKRDKQKIFIYKQQLHMDQMTLILLFIYIITVEFIIRVSLIK